MRIQTLNEPLWFNRQQELNDKRFEIELNRLIKENKNLAKYITVKLSNLMRTKSKSNRNRIEPNRKEPNRIETKSIESKRTESNRNESNRIENQKKFPYA